MRILLLVFLSFPAVAADLLPREFSIRATAVDASGFIYLTGNALLHDVPGTSGSLQPNPKACAPADYGCVNTFILKISPSGDSIVWMTYFHGNGNDSISAIAVAPDGNLVIAGATSSTDLLPDLRGYRTAPASLFLAKLSSDGDRFLAATYFGGEGADTIAVTKIDADGNIFVAGNAGSANFPTTPGAYQRTRGSGPPPPGFWECSQACSDQFVAKFNPALSKVAFASLIGTSVVESTSDLALGPDGSLYLSGTRGPYGGQGPGPTYPTLIHLNSSATALLYDTQVVDSYPHGGPLVVAPDGSAYVSTFTPRWPITIPRSMTWKVDPQGAALWSQEILGVVTSMAMNSEDEIVVTGKASDIWLRPTPGAPRPCPSPVDTSDLRGMSFVARWSPSTREVIYAGFLNARQSWLADPDRVLADSAYIGLPQFTLLPAGLPPKGTVTCVANAAGYDYSAISPGEVLSVFGSEIGPDREYPMELDANGLVRSELGGVTASIGGLPAPILYASPGQIDLVAPFATPMAGAIPVVVRRYGAPVAALDRPAAVSHAALFVTNGLRIGTLLALNDDGSTNSSTNPASVGSLVSVFATGMGAMNPMPLDGAVAGAEPSLVAGQYPVILTGMNMTEAAVEYVGSSPGLVHGIVRIEFRIPPAIVPREGTVSMRIGTSSGTFFVR